MVNIDFLLSFHHLNPQNTSCSVGQIRHMVYLMENALLNLPPGEEQMVWLIDFTGWSFTTTVSIKTTCEATHILQNYYPERLGYAILYNPPKIFQAFWKVTIWLRVGFTKTPKNYMWGVLEYPKVFINLGRKPPPFKSNSNSEDDEK